MLDKLKNALVSLFSGLAAPEGKVIADVLTRWGLDFGFDRTGNSTDHRTWKGEAQSRVSLDKYTDGSPCIVINRMLAHDWPHVFASAVHGAILAWRKDVGAKDEAGRERLIDADFTRLSQAIGLVKIAEKVERNGKEVAVSDKARRAWYGMSDSLTKAASAFAKDAPALPPAYIGTEASTAIGSILLPADATLADGSTVPVFVRISSFTAGERAVAEGRESRNLALESFNTLTACKSLRFNIKNKGFRLLSAKVAEKVEAKVKAQPIPVKAHKPQPVKAHKPQPQPQP